MKVIITAILLLIVSSLSIPAFAQVAPTLDQVIADSDGNAFLSWTQTGIAPAGGYDFIVDGRDTGLTLRVPVGTTNMTLVQGSDSPLWDDVGSERDNGFSNCFIVQARHTQEFPDEFPESDELCFSKEIFDISDTLSALDDLFTALDAIVLNLDALVTATTNDISTVNGTAKTNEVNISLLDAALIRLDEIATGQALAIIDIIPYKDGGDTRAVVYSISPIVPKEGEVTIFIYMPNGTLDGSHPGNEISNDFPINNPIDGFWNATLNDEINDLTESKLFEIIDANLPEGSPED